MRRAQDRARSATIKSRALGALKLARDENVPAKRADFFFWGTLKTNKNMQCFFVSFYSTKAFHIIFLNR